MRFSLKTIAGFSRLILALVLLIAAGLKSTDIVGFSRDIETMLIGFGVWENSASGESFVMFAIALVAIEFLLGGLLITGSSLRIITLSTLFLITGFTVISAWGTFSGKLESCGCFGALIERSPGKSLIENLILLTLATVLVLQKIPDHPQSKKPFFILISLAVIWSTAFYIFPPDWAALRTGMIWSNPDAQPPLPDSGTMDVWILDPDCLNCQDKIEILNNLSMNGMNLIGLTAATPGRIAEFKWDFQPQFAIHRTDSVTIKSFNVLYGSLICVVNGTVESILSLIIIKADEAHKHHTTGNDQ